MESKTTPEGWHIPAAGALLGAQVCLDMHLDEMRRAGGPLHTLTSGRRYARRVFEGPDALAHVTVTVRRANDDTELVRFNRNGSQRTLWNFTTGTAATRVGVPR